MLNNSKPSEKSIQTKVLRYLESLPDAFCFKVITANKRGIGDVVLCYRGKFINFEIKSPGGKLSAIQIFQGQLISKAGGLWCRIKSLDEVKNVLKGLE